MTWLGEDKNWFPNQTKKKTQSRPELKEAYSVDYVVVKCPVCGSKKCPAYSSDPPVRYHRCEKGHNFKSIEK